MKLPKIILVATDFSPCADEALHYAIDLAKLVDARLQLLHCWQVPLIAAGADLGGVFTAEVFEQLETTARSNLEVAAAKARAQFPGLQTKLLQCDARDGIIREATTLKADLIVVGTHGRHGLPRILIGSVAEYVVRHAPCTVLTVRAPQAAQ